MLPTGVVGLLVAATLAAAMSSIDSVATAGASLFCLDIYRPFIKPEATEKQLVHVGRIVIGVMAILTVIWLPIITILSDQVFVYIQSVQAYLSPPIFVAYFAGILWPRANERGAMSCLG
jgi:Na+/proline symporter|eukprot:COSAG02_NODE_6541_length_3506_cov_3.733490_2_plen_119_part_00